MIRAYVGSGGKTTLIKKTAEDCRRQGLRVLVTTSTHMRAEAEAILSCEAEEIIRALDEKGYAMAGCNLGEKMGPLPPQVYQAACAHADMVLVEADGSRHLPIKFPNATEPVIDENVEEIVVVCGLHALGKPLGRVAHRKELVISCLGAAEDTIITPEHVQKLVTQGYLIPLREKYPGRRVSVHATHDGSLYQRAVAGLLEAEADVGMIREAWFAPQPELVICGAGHVAHEVAQMAAMLDLRVRVIDDRPEFANRERFPLAADVICDSFENIAQHLVPDAFYTVLTRGHKEDFRCVKAILRSRYRYLGMIGSRYKVGATMERLRGEGFAQEELDRIFAPIGLAIGAKTPAEIAVSILAQVVQEKNKAFSSCVTREMSASREPGMLLVIIDKQGSAPRGVGSMMLVTKDGSMGSVGGGASEYAALCEAREGGGVRIRDYQLNSAQSAQEGMICGGSCRVLFIPV